MKCWNWTLVFWILSFKSVFSWIYIISYHPLPLPAHGFPSWIHYLRKLYYRWHPSHGLCESPHSHPWLPSPLLHITVYLVLFTLPPQQHCVIPSCPAALAMALLWTDVKAFWCMSLPLNSHQPSIFIWCHWKGHSVTARTHPAFSHLSVFVLAVPSAKMPIPVVQLVSPYLSFKEVLSGFSKVTFSWALTPSRISHSAPCFQ